MRLLSDNQAKIITLRAIALKLEVRVHAESFVSVGEDHNATSYSTETFRYPALAFHLFGEDHNATSYSTETGTNGELQSKQRRAKIITLRAIALKPAIAINTIGTHSSRRRS